MVPLIAGVDEAGRGPLAGPVIAAAVILKQDIHGVKDSKKLSAQQRQHFMLKIQSQAIAYAYGRAEVDEIDTLNIHHATLLAMKRAIESLSVLPHEVWIDGQFAPSMTLPCRTFVKGDEMIPIISAASILAKVHRDMEMITLDTLYPHYGFKQHKGYATALHKMQLKKYGPCPIHRVFKYYRCE